MSLKMLSGSVIQFLTEEMIPRTPDLKKSVSSAQLAYKANLDREKEEEEMKMEKPREEKEISERNN